MNALAKRHDIRDIAQIWLPSELKVCLPHQPLFPPTISNPNPDPVFLIPTL